MRFGPGMTRAWSISIALAKACAPWILRTPPSRSLASSLGYIPPKATISQIGKISGKGGSSRESMYCRRMTFVDDLAHLFLRFPRCRFTPLCAASFSRLGSRWTFFARLFRSHSTQYGGIGLVVFFHRDARPLVNLPCRLCNAAYSFCAGRRLLYRLPQQILETGDHH